MEREDIDKIIREEKVVGVVLKNGSRYRGIIFAISDTDDTIKMKDIKNKDKPIYVDFDLNNISEITREGEK